MTMNTLGINLKHKNKEINTDQIHTISLAPQLPLPTLQISLDNRVTMRAIHWITLDY